MKSHKKHVSMISCIWLNNQCRQCICKKENYTFISYLSLRLSWIQRKKRYSQEKQQERRSQHWVAAQQRSRHHFFSSSPQQVFVHNNFSHRTPEAGRQFLVINNPSRVLYIDMFKPWCHVQPCPYISASSYLPLLPINEVNWMNHTRL